MTPQELFDETQLKVKSYENELNDLAKQIQEKQNKYNQTAININACKTVLEVLQKVDGVSVEENT